MKTGSAIEQSSGDTGNLDDIDNEQDVDSDTTAEDADRLDRDVIFGTLKNRRRRDVLRYIRDEGGRSTIRDVSEHVAAVENDVSVPMVTSKQRKRVYVSLYQVHLPGMDRDGIVSFGRSGSIELTPRSEEVFAYLDGWERESSGHVPYIATTAVGGLLYLLGSLLLGPGSLFVSLTVIGLLVSIMALSVFGVISWRASRPDSSRTDAGDTTELPDTNVGPALADD